MLHAGEFVSLLLGEWVGAGGWDDGVKGEFACKKNDTRVTLQTSTTSQLLLASLP